MSDNNSIYPHSADHARQNNELDLYRESRKLNIACAKAIDAAVRENFDGMYLNADTAKQVIDIYGAERVTFVLANTLQFKDYDGRFSNDNKTWANSIDIPETDRERRSTFVADCHPAILDGFVRQARKEMESCKPSILGQLQEGKKAAAQDNEQAKSAPKRDKGMEV